MAGAPRLRHGRLNGNCPGAPDPLALAWATLEEGYGRKPIQLRPGALAAYRQMIETARKEAPDIFSDAESLTIFSGFRDPAADESRCTVDGNCNGVERARCSSHSTGLALDLNVGAAPGFKVDNSADENRRFMSRTAAYRWLVANADRFGFVNYVFEPWHWEWTGEPPLPGNAMVPPRPYPSTTRDNPNDQPLPASLSLPAGPHGLRP